LREHHPFSLLSDKEMAEVAQSYDTLEQPAGVHILRQGEAPSQHLYVIRSGAVRLVRDGQIIQVLEEGDCFGYPSMISQDAPSADVISEEATEIYRIPEKLFHRLTDNQEFAEFFLKNLGDRLRRLTSTSKQVTTIGGELTTAVGTLVVRPPVTVPPTTTVSEAAKTMRKAWVDVALVNDNPPGIITDHDFQVKVLAEELGPGTSVKSVMSRPLKTLPADTPVHAALLFMLEENIHHLPVTKEGKITGVVTATDLLRHQTRSPLYLMRYLENLESTTTLSRYSLEIAGMVDNLTKGGLDVAQIGRVIASINDTLLRRLLRLAEQELGPSPCPYAWIVFGSEGRTEQALITDQDNAIIYQKDSPGAQNYFGQLARLVVDDLLRAGFPPCPGGYMATNWCKPLQSWIELFEGWIKTPSPQNLLETAIFFDFRAVFGDLSVEPLEEQVNKAGEHGIFLAQLARAATEFKPPLGFFRRIRAEDGQVDLKKGGIAPIVSLARVYGLEGKIRARSTVDRLEGALAAGKLSEIGAGNLIETYRFLQELRLREQLADIKAGRTPENKVRLQSLTALENKHLKDAFLAIREMQEAASQQFRTDMLG
jgi:CBS domain-containing protein